MPRKKVLYSRDMRDRVVVLNALGVKREEISRALGVGLATVYRYLQGIKSGALLVKDRFLWQQPVLSDPKQVDQLRGAVESGFEIARKYSRLNRDVSQLEYSEIDTALTALTTILHYHLIPRPAGAWQHQNPLDSTGYYTRYSDTVGFTGERMPGGGFRKVPAPELNAEQLAYLRSVIRVVPSDVAYDSVHWIWEGPKRFEIHIGRERATVNITGTTTTAARFLYEQAIGIELPKRVFVRQRCAVDLCVYPGHYQIAGASHGFLNHGQINLQREVVEMLMAADMAKNPELLAERWGLILDEPSFDPTLDPYRPYAQQGPTIRSRQQLETIERPPGWKSETQRAAEEGRIADTDALARDLFPDLESGETDSRNWGPSPVQLVESPQEEEPKVPESTDPTCGSSGAWSAQAAEQTQGAARR